MTLPTLSFSPLDIGLALFELTAYAITAILVVRRLARNRNRLVEAASTDPLTGLLNRRAFMRALKAYDGEENMSVILFDLDRFKTINATFGMEAGDQLLVEIARRLDKVCGDHCRLYRLGGDLFALKPRGDAIQTRTEAAVARIRAALEAPFEIGPSHLTQTASLGVATAQGRVRSGAALFDHAHAALACAKSQHRGGTAYYSETLARDIERSHEIEREIGEGLTRGEFAVWYQPIVDRDGRTTGVEALARWPGRPGGELSPAQFIPHAERSGQIHALGLYVLRRACMDFRHRDDLRVSVNLSPAQFHDKRLVTDVASALLETGFPAERLELEITEGQIIDLPEQADAVMRDLRLLGVSIALDDYGSGYASIGYLRRYRFDKLKIDKSLIDGVGLDARAGQLLAATTAMAQALDIPVTAEGVETGEQAKLLRLAGVDSLQGYFFGRPQPAQVFAALAADGVVPLTSFKAASAGMR